MGTAKAALEWHGSTLLYRTASVLIRAVTGPAVAVAAPSQQLPVPPAGVELVRDRSRGWARCRAWRRGWPRSPTGRRWPSCAPPTCRSCTPGFVRAVLRALAAAGTDIALPIAHGYRQPLAAGYRTALAEPIAKLVAEGRLRPGMLAEHCVVAPIDHAALLADPELARLDAELDSVININTPDDYTAARARPPARIVVRTSGGGSRTVRAATLGAAATVVELPFDRLAGVTLNGTSGALDPQLPLVAGDTVEFELP
jgi:molybdenum cofactor guanylyltransferase